MVAVVAYESQLLRLRATADAASRPTLVAPGRRAVFTRYVLRGSVTARDPAAASNLHRLADYLLAPQAQQWISANTGRRPVVAGGAVSGAAFPQVRPVEIPRLPGLLDRLVGVYLGSYRHPGRVVFALDVSGSMLGRGMQDLRRAFASLDGSIAGRRGADVEVLLIPFGTTPQRTQRFTVTSRDPGSGLNRLADAVAHLKPGGNTAIYSALEQADDELAVRAGEGDEAVTSIVLVTDGKNTAGTDLAGFLRHRRALRPDRCARPAFEVCQVPVFPVLVGGADPQEMRRLATATTGAVHDARTVDLATVLRDVAAGR